MASTGNVFPTVGANVDRAGNAAWTNPGNVVSDNGSDTTGVVPTDYLVTSSYGFSSIPDDAIILGVTVRVEASETGTGSSNFVAQLHSATTPTLIGASKNSATVNGTTPTVQSLGGVADLWGATLTPAIVKAAGFGVSIWSTDTVNTLSIDYVTIAVEWAYPPGYSAGVMDAPRSAAPSRYAKSDGFIGPNLLLGTLGLAAAMAAAPVLRGPSNVQAVQRAVADPFEARNLLLTTLAAQPATKPFVVNDPSTGKARARVVFPDTAPANILLLSPAPAQQSNERPTVQGTVQPSDAQNLLLSTLAAAPPAGEPPFVQRAAEYQPRPRTVAAEVPPNVLLSTLKLAADMAAAPVLRGASTVAPVRRPASDKFEAPNLLLSTLGVVVSPDPLPIGLQDQFDYRPVPRVISSGSTHGQPLTLGIPAVVADPLPIGLLDQYDYRPVPKVVSSGSSHSQPLTLGIPAGVVQPPFRSTSFEERPRARRVVQPQNQGTRLGLDGVTGWAPIIQEITDGRGRRRSSITRIEFEQPPNLLLFTLSLPVQAQPIGEQWFAQRPIPRPVAADVSPNILLTTLAQQPQPLPIGAQWSHVRPIPRPVPADIPPNLLLGPIGIPPPKPFVGQWYDYRPIGRPIAPTIPPNLLLSTLKPQPFPVSIHNAHWEFERKYQYPASTGSFAGPLLTLGIEPLFEFRQRFACAVELFRFTADIEQQRFEADKEAHRFKAR